MNLKSIYCGEFANSMFKKDLDDFKQYQIIGKNCLISLEGNEIDIWLTPKGKLTEGFTERKLTGLINAWKGGEKWTRLYGEAFLKTKNFESIVVNRLLLGIKKKPAVSDEIKLARSEWINLANNNPQNKKMKTWEIWREGFLTSGMEGMAATAKKIGEIEADTFRYAMPFARQRTGNVRMVTTTETA